MKFHIIGDLTNSNKAKGPNDMFLVNNLNKEIKNGKQIFIFIFMDGCGPCNTTKPLWDNVRPKLEQQYKNDDSTIVVRLNKDLFTKFHNIGEEPAGFPTLRRIADSGNIIEEYERRFKHDIIAHIHAFGDICPKAKSFIHLGATSNFINDNVDIIIIKQSSRGWSAFMELLFFGWTWSGHELFNRQLPVQQHS